MKGFNLWGFWEGFNFGRVFGFEGADFGRVDTQLAHYLHRAMILSYKSLGGLSKKFRLFGRF